MRTRTRETTREKREKRTKRESDSSARSRSRQRSMVRLERLRFSGGRRPRPARRRCVWPAGFSRFERVHGFPRKRIPKKRPKRFPGKFRMYNPLTMTAESSGRQRRALVAAGFLLVSGCRARPTETRIVVVTATPAPVAAPAAIALPTPEPAIQSAEFSFPVVEPTVVEALPPLAELPEIRESAFEPRREPTPASLHEQMGRCLTFTTERFRPGYHMPLSVFASVRATNICSTAYSGRDVWIEVRVLHMEGGRSGLAGSKITRFQGMDRDGRYTVAIPGSGTADLMVQVDGLDQSVMYRLETILSSREEERERGD